MPSDVFLTRICFDATRGQARYSISQMDDFPTAIHDGLVKASGIMNLYQHLYIADGLPPNAEVLEFCCGRGLLIPFMLSRSHFARYLGVDISAENLVPALAWRRDSRIRFIQADVTELSAILRTKFDAIVYTSSVEHLDEASARASLRQASALLRPGGLLYLSTPHTPRGSVPSVQYKVHVYEWDRQDLLVALRAAHFRIVQTIGLLSNKGGLAEALGAKFGEGAERWYRALAATVPTVLLDTVAASCVPEAATELLFVCQRDEDATLDRQF